MKTLVSALILPSSAPPRNGELDYPPALDTHSSVTRAQVQQELAAARANGELVSGEEGYAVATFAQTGDKTRARCSKSWLPPVRKA